MRLQLLRNPQIVHQDGSATALNPNDAALLALLAVDGATSRERVIELLWPEQAGDPARARNALRQRLFRLRRAAGGDIVAADELMALAPGVVHDLQAIESELAADPAGALAGDLLGSQDFGALIAFSAWLDGARESWRSRRRDALAEIASSLESADRVAEALVCAERLARDEPLLEHAQRRLMRLHYRRGDRGAALAAYARLRDVLARELDEEPSAETVELAALIESSGALPVAAAPATLTLLQPPRLVGRGAEWQRIAAARALRRTVFVVGEPGIGKSRLVAEQAAAAGLRLVSARPGDQRVPYALAARLVRALALDHAALEPWQRAELARLAPELGAAAPGRLEPARLRAAADAAIALVAPQGIALDDVQFGDEATLELLPALDTAGWLLALRGHEMPPVVRDWMAALDAERTARIELAPLDAAAVAELLGSLALPGFDVAAWAPRVHRHSGGNPLFILETLRALLGGGTADQDELPLPDNLRLLIERRLDQLSPLALKLARVAAIGGADFSVDLAAKVLERHPLDLLDAWRELEAAQVMRGAAFAHDLIFEATRDTVPTALRRWLHEHCASWLEGHDGVPARLALHWREAGSPARAARAYERAAEAAAAAGRLAEQARWLEAAAEAYGEAGLARERFDALARRAIAARETMAPPAAMQVAAALLAAARDERERGIGHLHVAACHMNAARFDLALAEFDAAIACASAAADPPTAQHARYLQAVATAQVSGVADALARIEPLVAWAEAQPDASLRHSFAADLAILYDQGDQRRRARPLFERALAYFDRERETGNSAPTRMMFARSLVMLGELDEARTLLEAAVRERAEAAEGGGGYGVEVLNLGRVYCELGRYGAAIELLEPARERLQGADGAVVGAATTLVLARVFVHLGQSARAQVLLKSLPQGLPFHLRTSALWTRSLLHPDHAAERARLLDEALALFASHADLPFLRLPIEFDRLGCEPGEAALERLRAGVAECEGRELPALQMLGRTRLLEVLCSQRDFRAALPVAASLFDDLTHCRPVGVYLPELHQACRAAALGARDAALARRALDAAVRWIGSVAQQHVPPPFRDSFAHRNPVNRAILNAALGDPP